MIEYLFGIVCFVCWIIIMREKTSRKIRESRYWFVGYFGSLFLVSGWALAIQKLLAA